MASLEPPSKPQAFLALLQEGRPSLHLDARRAGVVVPAHLKGDSHLVLQYGIDLPIPITDLTVDDTGVRATLSFARTPHQTFVPWSAVYVITIDDTRGVLYPEDVPSDVPLGPQRQEGELDGQADAVFAAESTGFAGAPATAASSDGLTERTTRDLPGQTDSLEKAVGSVAENVAAPHSPRRTLRSIPLEVALPDPGAVSELEVEQVASSLASSGGAEAVNAPRRRRKPQLRLVK